jgi:hypothetical protein
MSQNIEPSGESAEDLEWESRKERLFERLNGLIAAWEKAYEIQPGWVTPQEVPAGTNPDTLWFNFDNEEWGDLNSWVDCRDIFGQVELQFLSSAWCEYDAIDSDDLSFRIGKIPHTPSDLSKSTKSWSEASALIDVWLVCPRCFGEEAGTCNSCDESGEWHWGAPGQQNV